MNTVINEHWLTFSYFTLLQQNIHLYYNSPHLYFPTIRLFAVYILFHCSPLFYFMLRMKTLYPSCSDKVPSKQKPRRPSNLGYDNLRSFWLFSQQIWPNHWVCLHYKSSIAGGVFSYRIVVLTFVTVIFGIIFLGTVI